MRNESNAELAVPDIQRRLKVLGYQLGDEAKQGLFGDRTASAVASFKESIGLGYDDVLDQATWIALKDASMQMGDRLLYLHMPHFRGRDVGDLQAALSSMGFSCISDMSFGPETEEALRQFQENMGLEATGILNEESLTAIQRFKHIWEGKRGFFLDERDIPLSRSREALTETSVCFFGVDEATRSLADRIANLARATTTESRIVSVSALTSEPSKDMVLIGLEHAQHTSGSDIASNRALTHAPEGGRDVSEPYCVVSDGLELSLKEALQQVKQAEQNRIRLLVDLTPAEGDTYATESQHVAIVILDSLCSALESLKAKSS